MLLLLFAGPPVTSPGEDLSATEGELVWREQELFDALAPGNPTLRKKQYAEDCLYHDEKGRSLNKVR